MTDALYPLTRTASVEPRPRDGAVAEIVAGCAVAFCFFGLFLGWAAFAPLDSAATAQGEVAVAGHRQSVQHRDGGIVAALNVREGQKVREGDVLMELSGADIKAQAQTLAAQVLGLQAQRARLQAEQMGQSQIVWPAAFAALTGEDLADAQAAMKVQQTQFQARAMALSAQKRVLDQKSAELRQQIEGYRSQIASSDEQRRLLAEELDGVKSLAAEGYAPQTRVRSLQRSQADLAGQRGQYAASIAQAGEQAGESRLQILQLDRQRAEDVVAQLRDVAFQLNDAEPKLSAARDRLARQQVRATTSGSVVGLSVFNTGSVIGPGQKLMDIVPDKAGLIITARVSPSEADDIRVGKTVQIKFPSLHDRNIPVLEGRLSKLSADSLIDDKSGARYFQVEATVSPATLSSLKAADQGEFELKPGLPAQMLIPLRRRTALQYLMQPLSESLWRALREK